MHSINYCKVNVPMWLLPDLELGHHQHTGASLFALPITNSFFFKDDCFFYFHPVD